MSTFAHNRFRDFWEWLAGELRPFFAALQTKSRKPLGSESSTISEEELVQATLGEKRGDLILVSSGAAIFAGSHFKLRGVARRLPLGRLVTIGEISVRDKTPFVLEHVRIIPYPGVRNVEESCFYVVKKEHLDLSLNLLTADSVRISRFGILDGRQVRWIPLRALERLHPVFHHIRNWRNFLIVAFTVLLIALGATYAHVLFRYSVAEQKLNNLIDARRGEALQVRKLLADREKSTAAIDAARKSKNQAVPILRVWEELTRVLPDDAWLTDISFDEDSLTIAGFAAQSAAGLIVILGSSPTFSEPSFTSPVVRVPGQTGERFEIKLRVRAI
ncbi:PilN domain-containing protein [Agrobacterium radiobacter]|uniref:PilN domain-containing protein n=1 Tax=Agrobacterium radiobacter TaxID=362 RepID=A0ABD5LPJ0_AGRRD